MPLDICGYHVSTDREASDEWDRMHLRFLAHGADTADLLAAVLARDPGFAMAHAVKGLFLLLLGRRELEGTARQALVDARAGEASSPRERLYIDGLAVWLDGRPSRTAALMDEIVAGHPDDTLAAKISQAIHFLLGDVARLRRSIDEAVKHLSPSHPARGYMLGCQAFALEETGAFAEAEARGHEALAMVADDAWGLHAVAHVYDMTGRAGDGLRWLDGREAAWMHCNNFRYHVWWHKALMHLDLGDTDAALDLYDEAIRCDRTDDFRDIANAASLLCRLELDGARAGDRWDELAELAAARTGDGCLIFADLHYVLALIGGDREDAAGALVERIARDADRRDCDAGVRMADPGLDAARGLKSFGTGDYASAFVALNRAWPSLQRAGGSHAQRDVFDRLTIESAIRSGSLGAAAELLEDRTQRRGGNEDGYAATRRSFVAARLAG